MTPLKIVLFSTLVAAGAQAVIIDRIAVVVNSKQVIKDSDIDRAIRVTDYLNGEPLSINPAERKKAAQRLIDQAIIRREVEIGGYPRASEPEIDNFLRTVDGQRGSPLRYGISPQELRKQAGWQLTVLSFIEQRFRPAVLVNQDEIDQYVKAHPGVTPEQAQNQLTEERVTTEFNSWLDRAHGRTNVQYFEAELQ